MPLLIFFTVRNDNLCAQLACCMSVVCVQRDNKCRELTEFGHNISTKETGTSKDSHNVSTDSTVSRSACRDDRFIWDWCDKIMNCPL